MSKEIYEKALEDAFAKMEEAVRLDMSHKNFNWDLLIEMIIIEDSPLKFLFGTKTVQLAELYSTAKKLATVAYDIENYVEPEPGTEVKALPDTKLANGVPQTDKEWDSFEDL